MTALRFMAVLSLTAAGFLPGCISAKLAPNSPDALARSQSGTDGSGAEISIRNVPDGGVDLSVSSEPESVEPSPGIELTIR